MNERIHLTLDGDLDPASLNPVERQELASHQSLIRELTSTIQGVHRPDLTERVMAAVTRAEPKWELQPAARGAFDRAFGWLWAPRAFAFALRPVYAFAALILVSIGTYYTARGTGSPTVEGVAAVESPPVLYVQFRLDAPGASSVQLTGSFTDWDSRVTLVESAPGVWSTLIALEPGVHDYAFVVDGRTWVADPAAPAVEDGFGGVNSRLFLTNPGGNV